MKYRLILSFILFFIFHWAQAQSVEVFYKKGRSTQKADWPIQIEKKWQENREGVPVLSYVVEIDLPSQFTAKKTKSKRKNKVKVLDGGRKLKVFMASLADRILILTKNRRKKAILIKLSDEVDVLNVDRCESKKLILKRVVDSQKLPFRVEMNCYESDQEEFLVVSVPKEVRWASTTIPENRGKGENWKEYRIEDLPSGDGEVRGVFTFRYRKKNYKIELRSKPDPDVLISQKGKQTQFYVGAGLMSLNVKSDISDISESPLSFVAGVETELPLWSLLAGLNVVAALSSGGEAEEKPPEFFEARVHLGHFFNLGESFRVSPLLLAIFQQSSDPNVLLTISHNQVGVGAAIEWDITSDFDFRFDAWYSGFLAANPTSHFGIQLSLAYQLFETIGLGINVGNQSLSVEGGKGTQNEMSETHYGMFIKF